MSSSAVGLWTRAALEQALFDLPAPVADVCVDSDGTFPQLTWNCSETGRVIAVGDADGRYTLRAHCSHSDHKDLELLQTVLITNVMLSDRTGTAILAVPERLTGAYLAFSVDAAIPIYVRVTAILDPEYGLDAVERSGVTIAAGPRRVNRALNINPRGPNAAVVARGQVYLHIDVLTLRMAHRDPSGAAAIDLWRMTFPVIRR
jgi:hypothetical protein